MRKPTPPDPKDLQPVVRPMEPSRVTGRPKRDQIDLLSEKVRLNREYYLANADERIMYQVAFELPIECTAACPYMGKCYVPDGERPYMKYETAPPSDLREMLCPLEVDLAMTLFAGYLTELNIDKTKPTELQSASELVSIHLLKRRILIRIGVETDNELSVDEQIPGTGGATRKAAHPLFATKKDLDARESTILKQFQNTREATAKLMLEQKEKTKKDAAGWMSEIIADG